MDPDRLARLYGRLQRQMEVLAETAGLPEEELTGYAEAVSAWAPAQHLEHLAITGGEVLSAVEAGLRAGNEAAPRRPGFMGWMVLATGWLPRGAGKALKSWSPSDARPGRAREGLAALAARLEGFEPRLPEIAAARATVRHPVLGHFTPAQWLRFLEVHQNHHLKIIRDVRRALRR